MAKSKKSQTSKSEQIRAYIKQHPTASAQEIASAVGVKPALVYNVKSSLKSKGRGAKKAAKPNESRRHPRVSAPHESDVDRLNAAAALIEAAGSAGAAREAISVVEELGRRVAGRI